MGTVFENQGALVSCSIFIVLESELMFRCNCVVSLKSAFDEPSYVSRVGGKVILDDIEVDVPVIFCCCIVYNLHVVYKKTHVWSKITKC